MRTLASVAGPTSDQDIPAGLTPGGMYPTEVDVEGRTLHARECQSAFGRRDWRCTRCLELLHSAPPRDGWSRRYFGQKLDQQRRLLFPHE